MAHTLWAIFISESDLTDMLRQRHRELNRNRDYCTSPSNKPTPVNNQEKSTSHLL